MLQVAIGKGITLPVDVERLPQDVLDHVVYIGLRNVLMDSHASATAESGKDARGMAEKKLASMYAGEVRAAGERTTDKVAQDMAAQAKLAIDTALASRGIKKSKVPNYKELVANYVKAHESELREKAEARVAAARESADDVSLEDLGL
jgi:hypothetical protein